MSNHYLQVLQLQSGASKSDIKSAYRRLSKIYHPDISKDPAAKEKFIEINEAYKFLMDVGPRPSSLDTSTTSTPYNYNPFIDEYEERRRRAREFARWKAKEAARRQVELVKYMIKAFDLIALFILGFNILLTIDFILPASQVDEPIISIQAIYERKTYRYDDLKFKLCTFRIDSGQLQGLNTHKSHAIYSSFLLHIPLYMDLESTASSTSRAYQSYSVYKVFGVFILLTFLFYGIYRFTQISLDSQLTFAIFLFAMACFQFYIFLKF